MCFRNFFTPSGIGTLLAGLGVLFALPAPAQSTGAGPRWWGQVVTVTGQPLAGVSVWVPGTTRSTSTNAEGQFLLPDLPPGADRLRMELPTFLAVELILHDTTRLPLRVRLHSTRPPVHARPRGKARAGRTRNS